MANHTAQLEAASEIMSRESQSDRIKGASICLTLFDLIARTQ